MAKSMADRKKAGPQLPKWSKITGSHKALKSKDFDPAMEPLLKDYGDVFPEYDKLDDEKAKLSDIIDKLKETFSDAGKEIHSYAQNVAKLSAADAPTGKDWQTAMKSKDPSEVVDALAALAVDWQDAMNKRNSAWDMIKEVSEDELKQIKKVGAEYKSKAGDFVGRLKTCEAAEESRRYAILDRIKVFQGKAAEIDHPEIVKALEAFSKNLV